MKPLNQMNLNECKRIKSLPLAAAILEERVLCLRLNGSDTSHLSPEFVNLMRAMKDAKSFRFFLHILYTFLYQHILYTECVYKAFFNFVNDTHLWLENSEIKLLRSLG
jgi:hypothetical protein